MKLQRRLWRGNFAWSVEMTRARHSAWHKNQYNRVRVSFLDILLCDHNVMYLISHPQLGNQGIAMQHDKKSHCHVVQIGLFDWTIWIWGIIYRGYYTAVRDFNVVKMSRDNVTLFRYLPMRCGFSDQVKASFPLIAYANSLDRCEWFYPFTMHDSLRACELVLLWVEKRLQGATFFKSGTSLLKSARYKTYIKAAYRKNT